MRNPLVTSSEQLFQLEESYKKNLPDLLSFAKRFVPEDVAGDLVQDVFLRLWQGSRAFLNIPEGPARQMYLYRSVRNACKDWLKHQIAVSNHSNETPYLLKMDEADHNALLSSSDFEQKLSRVESHVDRLPARCREVFLMHYRQRRPSVEIAEYFGISKRTVEAQLYKALQVLRESLSKEEEE